MEPCAILDYLLDLDKKIAATNLLWFSHSFQFANFSCYFAFLYSWCQVGLTN
jgi:hypothetical protein